MKCQENERYKNNCVVKNGCFVLLFNSRLILNLSVSIPGPYVFTFTLDSLEPL